MLLFLPAASVFGLGQGQLEDAAASGAPHEVFDTNPTVEVCTGQRERKNGKGHGVLMRLKAIKHANVLSALGC